MLKLCLKIQIVILKNYKMEESFDEVSQIQMLSDVKIFSIDNEYKKFLKGLIAEKYIGFVLVLL